jgi:hypothetical protein
MMTIRLLATLAAVGDMPYALGGEGGPKLYHPATLQIGKIVAANQP